MQSTLSAVRRMMGKDTAEECKAYTEKQIEALQAELDALGGKEHQKERAAKGKKLAELRSGDRYVDACRVVKGLAPVNGHFAASATEASESPLDAEVAERMAAQATADLRRLEESTRHEKAASAGAGEEKVTAADPEVEALRQEERRLLSRLAAQGATNLSPSGCKEVERLLTEIAELKAGLAAKGLNENEQDKDEGVLMRLVRVAELRQREHRDKKQERRDRSEVEDVREELEALRAKLDAHKRKLRDEGLTKEDVKQHPEVGDLEERLAMLQRMGGA